MLNKVSYADFKGLVLALGAGTQYITKTTVNRTFYNIFSLDLGLKTSVEKLAIPSADQTDFETNIIPISNLKQFNKDSEGSNVTKNKLIPTGFGLYIPCFNFKINDPSNTILDYSSEGIQITAKYYDSNGVITAIKASCVKTIIDFIPSFTYYTKVGYLNIKDTVTSKMVASQIIAPLIPKESGGSIKILDNKRIDMMDSIYKMDGQTIKKIPYIDEFTPSTTIRFTFESDTVNVNPEVELELRIYRML